MEWLEGETLDDRLTRGPLPPADVIQSGVEMAEALAHAHGAHLVHRDVKPSNVMLTATGVKLLDFGLAKAVAVDANGSSTATADGQRLTGEGVMVGTVQYMAPEQLEGKPVDARSDIFALGTVLYEMAAGRKAFQGDSTASLIAAILTTEPERVSAVRAAAAREPLPVALDHVVARCLAKRPDDRWQTARDVAVELQWTGRPDADRPSPAARAASRGPWWRAAAIAMAVVTAATLLARVPFGSPSPPREATPLHHRAAAGDHHRAGAESHPLCAVTRRAARGVRRLDRRPLAALDPVAVVARGAAARRHRGRPGAVLVARQPVRRLTSPTPPANCGRSRDRAGRRRQSAPRRATAVRRGGADGTILFTQFRDGLYRVRGGGGHGGARHRPRDRAR